MYQCSFGFSVVFFLVGSVNFVSLLKNILEYFIIAEVEDEATYELHFGMLLLACKAMIAVA